jgi:hypothetical protein
VHIGRHHVHEVRLQPVELHLRRDRPD